MEKDDNVIHAEHLFRPTQWPARYKATKHDQEIVRPAKPDIKKVCHCESCHANFVVTNDEIENDKAACVCGHEHVLSESHTLYIPGQGVGIWECGCGSHMFIISEIGNLCVNCGNLVDNSEIY